jgi:hypothetical protein
MSYGFISSSSLRHKNGAVVGLFCLESAAHDDLVLIGIFSVANVDIQCCIHYFPILRILLFNIAYND